MSSERPLCTSDALSACCVRLPLNRHHLHRRVLQGTYHDALAVERRCAGSKVRASPINCSSDSSAHSQSHGSTPLQASRHTPKTADRPSTAPGVGILTSSPCVADLCSRRFNRLPAPVSRDLSHPRDALAGPLCQRCSTSPPRYICPLPPGSAHCGASAFSIAMPLGRLSLRTPTSLTSDGQTSCLREIERELSLKLFAGPAPEDVSSPASSH